MKWPRKLPKKWGATEVLRQANIYHWKWLCFVKILYMKINIHFCIRFRSSFFYIKWGISKLCVSNASNASLGIEKRWSLNYIFDVTETKRSHWVSNQDCTADDPSIQNILFELMCVSSHWRGGKRPVFGGWFSAISSSTNGDVPCRIDSTTFR